MSLSRCRKIWRELVGVPLLPLADGTAGSFGSSIVPIGNDRYILATRRQQGLLPPLKSRFVHPKAATRLRDLFRLDEFLEVLVAT